MQFYSMRIYRAKANGFTLIELVTVIGLISVIALFTGKRFWQEYEEKQAWRIMGDIYTVAQAAQKYYMANGLWPDEENSNPCNDLNSASFLKNVYYSNINTDLNPLNLNKPFECPELGTTGEHPLLYIRWEMPNKKIGDLLNVNMPMSVLKPENYTSEGNTYTAYYLEVGVPSPSVSPKLTTQAIKHARIHSGDELVNACVGGLVQEVLAYAPTAYCHSGTINGFRVLEQDVDGDENIRFKTEVKPTLGTWVNTNSFCGDQEAKIDIIYRCIKP